MYKVKMTDMPMLKDKLPIGTSVILIILEIQLNIINLFPVL